MISIGLFASLAAAFAFLCLLINLAALALPAWVAGTVFFFALKSGESLIGAGVLGFLSASAAYFVGILICAMAPSRGLAVLIRLIFSLPAGAAGYHLGAGLGHLIFVAPVLQQCCALTIAILVFILCWRRLAPMAAIRLDPGSEKTRFYEQPVIDVAFTKVMKGRQASPPGFLQEAALRLPSRKPIMLD